MKSNQRFAISLVGICLLLVIGLFILPSHVSAATPAYSLTTSPVSLDLSIHPGTKVTKTIEVMNNGASPVPITMQLKEFGAYGTNGQAAITTPKANNPSPSWVHFSPSSFTANPGVWTQVSMTISLPTSANLGYYYAALFTPTSQITSTAPGVNTIKGSNAILILVDTGSANETRQVEVANFSVSKHVYEYLPANFTVTVKNTGNIFLAPTGNIFISRNSNITNTIDTLIINGGKGNVLPDSSRTFQATWSDGFPVFKDKLVNGHVVTNKNGTDVEQLHWNLSDISKFRIGEYYAQVTLIYNNGTRIVPLIGVVSFWVIPYKLLAVALIIVLLIGFGVWVIIRSIVRKFRKRSKREPRQKEPT